MCCLSEKERWFVCHFLTCCVSCFHNPLVSRLPAAEHLAAVLPRNVIIVPHELMSSLIICGWSEWTAYTRNEPLRSDPLGFTQVSTCW